MTVDHQAPGRPATIAPTLVDPDLQARFARDGFVVVDALPAATVHAARDRFFAAYGGETENACHRSTESGDPLYRERLHDLITETVGPIMDRILVDHRVLMTGSLVKWQGPDSAMPPHQDWTAVDERSFRSVNIWLPLCDVDIENGAVAVLPGSHHRLTGLRVNSNRPFPFPDPWDGLDPSTMQSVPVRAGQCLVIDHGVLHASPPNQTSAPRVALLLGAVPARAPMHHYWRRADDRIDHLAVDDPGFYLRCAPGVEPTGTDFSIVETIDLVRHPSTARSWIFEQAAAASRTAVGAVPDPEPWSVVGA